MYSPRAIRLLAAVTAVAALIGMGALTACSSGENEAPETITTDATTTTTTRPAQTTVAPAEKTIDPRGGNLFTPGNTASPAQTVAPGQHHPPGAG